MTSRPAPFSADRRASAVELVKKNKSMLRHDHPQTPLLNFFKNFPPAVISRIHLTSVRCLGHHGCRLACWTINNVTRAAQTIKTPSASRQVFFHQLLVGARKQWLLDGLSDAVSRIDPNQLKRELAAYIPVDVQRIVAAAGVRDEQVFPVPVVLEAKPTLIGYYRLLLGVPQKWFYAGGTGMGPFKSMEMRGRLTETQKARLPEFCKAMTTALSELVRQMSPTITMLDVKELPLLTIGSQFQGSNNTRIGKQAIEDTFLALVEIVKGHILDQTNRKLIVKNAAGRKVIIGLGSDPDIGIAEEFANQLRKKVAIEVKGRDRSKQRPQSCGRG
jgi:hypothetical protein